MIEAIQPFLLIAGIAFVGVTISCVIVLWLIYDAWYKNKLERLQSDLNKANEKVWNLQKALEAATSKHKLDLVTQRENLPAIYVIDRGETEPKKQYDSEFPYRTIEKVTRELVLARQRDNGRGKFFSLRSLRENTSLDTQGADTWQKEWIAAGLAAWVDPGNTKRGAELTKAGHRLLDEYAGKMRQEAQKRQGR